MVAVAFFASGHCLDPLTSHWLDPLPPSGQLHARGHGHQRRAEGLGLEGDLAVHVGKCGISRLFHAIIGGFDSAIIMG